MEGKQTAPGRERKCKAGLCRGQGRGTSSNSPMVRKRDRERESNWDAGMESEDPHWGKGSSKAGTSPSDHTVPSLPAQGATVGSCLPLQPEEPRGFRAEVGTGSGFLLSLSQTGQAGPFRVGSQKPPGRPPTGTKLGTFHSCPNSEDGDSALLPISLSPRARPRPPTSAGVEAPAPRRGC